MPGSFFEMGMTNADDEAQISALEAQLNNDSAPWADKMAATGNDEPYAKHENIQANRFQEN